MALVGIDLGTTNSLLAVWGEDGPRLIENALGDTLTPSAVSIADDGAVLVGKPALDRLITHPDRSVASFKRWMGSATGATLAGKAYRAEELSALVLRALKEDAEARLGEPVTEAIISVPAYFNDPQRKATLDAARLAGLTVERLINEPTAAALAHGLEQTDDACFMVLDLGGGTFDVSILHRYEGVMEIRASSGDAFLGGNDFRDAVAAEIARRAGIVIDTLPRADLNRLLRTAEEVKCALSGEDSASYDLTIGGTAHQGSLDRAGFEGLVQSLLKRLRLPIERALTDSDLQPQEIDQVVLVGGATRMPLVRTMVARLFERFPLIHPRPDHLIALGASIQAGRKARHAALDDVIMTDVCPFTLGIAVLDRNNADDKLFSPIIERNVVVPISRMSTYCTTKDNQSEIRVEVLQGENLRASQNVAIGSISVPVPKAPAGSQGIDVRFTYDINGALEVEVTVHSTGEVRRSIFRNQASLSEAELEARFQSLVSLKMPPREQAENRALIARAERLYAEALGDAREQIQIMLRQFEEAINDQHLKDPEGLRQRFSAALAPYETRTFRWE